MPSCCSEKRGGLSFGKEPRQAATASSHGAYGKAYMLGASSAPDMRTNFAASSWARLPAPYRPGSLGWFGCMGCTRFVCSMCCICTLWQREAGGGACTAACSCAPRAGRGRGGERVVCGRESSRGDGVHVCLRVDNCKINKNKEIYKKASPANLWPRHARRPKKMDNERRCGRPIARVVGSSVVRIATEGSFGGGLSARR